MTEAPEAAREALERIEAHHNRFYCGATEKGRCDTSAMDRQFATLRRFLSPEKEAP